MSSAKAYSIAASYYHWVVAVPLMGSIASVLKCQQSPKEEKGKWCVYDIVVRTRTPPDPPLHVVSFGVGVCGEFRGTGSGDNIYFNRIEWKDGVE